MILNPVKTPILEPQVDQVIAEFKLYVLDVDWQMIFNEVDFKC